MKWLQKMAFTKIYVMVTCETELLVFLLYFIPYDPQNDRKQNGCQNTSLQVH